MERGYVEYISRTGHSARAHLWRFCFELYIKSGLFDSFTSNSKLADISRHYKAMGQVCYCVRSWTASRSPGELPRDPKAHAYPYEDNRSMTVNSREELHILLCFNKTIATWRNVWTPTNFKFLSCHNTMYLLGIYFCYEDIRVYRL